MTNDFLELQYLIKTSDLIEKKYLYAAVGSIILRILSLAS